MATSHLICVLDGLPVFFHGNFAQVLALAEAHGADTLSATVTNALAIENHFSFVNAVGIVAL